MNSIDLLSQLISFDTTSKNSNLALIDFVANLLDEHGITARVKYNEDKTKANLFATVGPEGVAGVLLSGHTDVVPANPEHWQSPPFVASIRDNKLYGRGSSDMKGFLACAIVALTAAKKRELATPLHLCLSFDEEVGCLGVREILSALPEWIVPPRLCLIGEPTEMQIAIGHKGKAVYRACCSGENGHSSTAPNYRNAIHVACEVVASLMESQQQLTASGARDADYDIPYSTIHVGKIAGGTALNVVPDSAVLDYEIRYLADDRIADIEARIEAAIAKRSHAEHVTITPVNAYPGLSTPKDHPEIAFLQALLGGDAPVGKISFGTEGGLFAETFDSPVFVCGPGSIHVAHKPDEFIALSQLSRCDTFLSQLLNALAK